MRRCLSLLLISGATLALSYSSGCGSKKAAPTTRPLGPPVFDSRRGGGSFPIEADHKLRDPEDLRLALTSGYLARLNAPAGYVSSTTQPVSLGTGRPDRLESLMVTVSGWRVNPKYEPTELSRSAALETSFKVASVVYSAEPLIYEKGELSLRLEATDATMHILKDSKSNTRGLVLAGAKSGYLRMYAKTNDIQDAISSGARSRNTAPGASLSGLKVTLTSDNPRSFTTNIEIKGSWLFLPMTLNVTGRLDVDKELIANFSEFSATGSGPAGDLLAPLVNKAISKLNGRRSPLLAFRDNKTKATDFQVTAKDHFDLIIKFGQ